MKNGGANIRPQGTPATALLFGYFALRDLGHHLAVLDDEHAVGQRRRETEILLHQHDGVVALLELADHFAQLLHDHRREAFGYLVEQQQAGTGAQHARHRQHLLLAAGQARTLAVAALPQVREHRRRSRPGLMTAAANLWRQQQVFLAGLRLA
jgi:hypothetical protein